MTLEAYRRWTPGHVPSWSDGLWSGFPLLADPVTAGFYPVHWLSFFLTPEPHLRAFDLASALHAGILVAGVAMLLAELHASRRVMAFAAALTVLGVQFEWWIAVCLPAFATLSWWPWTLLAVERLAQPARAPTGPLVLGSATLAAQVLAGHPEFAAYGGTFAVAWLLTRQSGLPFRPRIGRAVLLVGGGLLLAAPQLLTAAAELANSPRPRSPLLLLDAMPASPAMLVDPRRLASPAGRPPFLGAATLALAFVALVRRAPRAGFLWVMAFLGWVLAIGAATPVYGWFSAVPPFALFPFRRSGWRSPSSRSSAWRPWEPNG